jgi:hypothetical protein
MESSPSSLPARNGGAGRVVADQLLLTHCPREVALLGQGGFGIRAASTSDLELLKWAFREISPYELPFDMQRARVMISQTPRRLALIPAPGNRVALVHSSYLPGDSCVPPRPHAFVSHVLVYSHLDIDTRTAAAAWNSPDWQKHEVDRGASQALEPMEGVPQGTLLHDQAVTDFLSGSDAPADQSVASTIFPSRFEADPEMRRSCVRATLHAVVRTLEEGAARTRVCVLAEPGTVALLAYIAARLLPATLTDRFWFSTYEPPQTSLREDKVARLVGSFVPRPIDRGETEFLRRAGYLVDMIRFPPASGPDLAGDATSWPLEELLTLAAAGDWPAVDAIQAVWAADPPAPTLAALSQAVRVRHLADGPRRGSVTVEELTALRQTTLGPEERAGRLREWTDAAATTTPRPALPAGLHWLLLPEDEHAFRSLIKSPALDARHAGLALCLAMAGKAGWTPGPSLIRDLDGARLAAFVTVLEDFPDREAVIRRLFSGGFPGVQSLALRLLQPPVSLSGDWLETLLTAARCDDPEWQARWLTGKPLEALLGRLGPGSSLGQRIVQGLVRRVTTEGDDDTGRAGELSVLASACQKFPDVLGPDDFERLASRVPLRPHSLKPGGNARPPRAAGRPVSPTHADRRPGHSVRDRILFLGLGILIPLAAQLVLWIAAKGTEETSTLAILRKQCRALEAENKDVTGKLRAAEAIIKDLRARIPSQDTASKPKDVGGAPPDPEPARPQELR